MKWISVEDRVPKNYFPVIVLDERGLVWVAKFTLTGKWVFMTPEIETVPWKATHKITHWMHIEDLEIPVNQSDKNEEIILRDDEWLFLRHALENIDSLDYSEAKPLFKKILVHILENI